MKDLDISVATESQRGEVTPPRPRSWSVAKLDIMWRQYPPVLVLPLLAIAKGREFSSESVFCYNPKSHTSTTRRAHSSGLLLSSCPLGSMLSLCSGCSTTWNIIPSRPPAFQPSSAHHTLQDLSPAKWGPLLNVFPTKRSCFPACSSTQEKAMEPHSSTLAWKTPWMEEPGRLKSMGSLRVGQFYPSYLVIVVQYRQRVQKVSALMIMVYTF